MTRPVHPFWGLERTKAYTEIALFVCANGAEAITESKMVTALSDESKAYATNLGHAHDETFRDTLFGDIEQFDIIRYDTDSRRYLLGEAGRLLVDNFFEELLESH